MRSTPSHRLTRLGLRQLGETGAHCGGQVIADALRNLSAKQGELKFLGSYPVGGPLEAGVERRKAAGRAWKHAATWVESLRAQIREPE